MEIVLVNVYVLFGVKALSANKMLHLVLCLVVKG